MPLNSIADRLTPSTPIELTYGAQPVAVGRKFTTLFGHKASSGDTGVDYQVYEVVNVGDGDAAKAEVDALAGAGSQIGKMAKAFVDANVLAGRSNYPAFRVVLLPNSELHFGPSGEAINAVKNLRNDMLVSCYPASDSTNRTTLQNLAILLSGPDRDLKGQFGSFYTVGSLDVLSTAITYAINSRYGIVAYLQDTNTALLSAVDGDTTSGSNIIANIASTAGILVGAHVVGTGIPVGAVVEKVNKSSVQISANATATGSAVSLDFQNVVSQPAEIVAAAHAAGLMSLAAPYNPVQGVAIGGLVPPHKASDLIDVDPNGASEQALNAGLSPLTVQPGGIVGYIRSRTTAVFKPDNVTKLTSYFDWQDIVNMYDFREVCYQVSQNPPFNNNPGGTKASQQIADKFKDEVLREAMAFEQQGRFQFVKELSKFFVVQVSTTSRGRFDFRIPVDVTPGLYVIAGNIVAVAFTDNFTL